MQKDFISLHDVSVYEFNHLLDTAEDMKKRPRHYSKALKDQVLAMIFQKPSLRTRMTFDVGMLQLGGKAIYLSPADNVMGSRESIYDVAKNLERWVDGIMIRTFEHQILLDLAKYAKIPVINALTDFLHPCQAVADFLALREKRGSLAGLKLAYVGDGNNVCHSLMLAAAKAGMTMAVGTPAGYEPDPRVVAWAGEDGKETGFELVMTNDPAEAVKNADAVYTDTWISMGQESEKEKKIKIFSSYQVNKELMAKAKPEAFFMHCLPAHRGEEVTDEVMDSPNSIVFDEAENRLHAHKAVMFLLMGKK